MYYTKLALLIVTTLLWGCASKPTVTPTPPPLKKVDSTTQKQKKDNPENLLMLYQGALAKLKSGDLETAEQDFLKVTKTHQDLAGAWANLTVIYIKQARYEKAEESVQKALENNPQMAQALNMAGFLEERHGNINEAKNYYEKAIENKPYYALAHYNLALLHDVYLQNIEEAVNHYQKYLSLLDVKDKKTENWVKELKRNIDRGGA